MYLYTFTYMKSNTGLPNTIVIGRDFERSEYQITVKPKVGLSHLER